jgi:septal ring factor EnvC (AmiA/AmiB activator)
MVYRDPAPSQENINELQKKISELEAENKALKLNDKMTSKLFVDNSDLREKLKSKDQEIAELAKKLSKLEIDYQAQSRNLMNVMQKKGISSPSPEPWTEYRLFRRRNLFLNKSCSVKDPPDKDSVTEQINFLSKEGFKVTSISSVAFEDESEVTILMEKRHE